MRKLTDFASQAFDLWVNSIMNQNLLHGILSTLTSILSTLQQLQQWPPNMGLIINHIQDFAKHDENCFMEANTLSSDYYSLGDYVCGLVLSSSWAGPQFWPLCVSLGSKILWKWWNSSSDSEVEKIVPKHNMGSVPRERVHIVRSWLQTTLFFFNMRVDSEFDIYRLLCLVLWFQSMSTIPSSVHFKFLLFGLVFFWVIRFRVTKCIHMSSFRRGYLLYHI